MSAFRNVHDISPQQLWEGVIVRPVHGERITIAHVELDARVLLPEHRHENEQVGILIEGSMTFRIGDETREATPGTTWRIPSNAPHEVVAGPNGAVVVEVFSPPRDDWNQIEQQPQRQARWPA